MPKSSHEVPVIKIKLEEHPNADKLALVRIDDMRIVGVRKDEWKDGDLGAFIQADMVVPDTEIFKWMGKDRRVRPRRFRGVMSYGILVPAPAGSQEGDEVSELLGVTRYEPPEPPPSLGGETEKPPRCEAPVYDLESYYKYHHLLVPDESVVITEKLHGANARFLFWDNEMHVGSHRQWKRQGANMWWNVLAKYPQIELYCRLHPGHIVYGEIFGQVQDLKYDAAPGEVYFRVFDVRVDKGWLPFPEVLCCTGIPAVPLLYQGPYDSEKVSALISGQSAIASHIREGVVIGPVKERYDPEIGRVKLKAVSMEYLERRK